MGSTKITFASTVESSYKNTCGGPRFGVLIRGCSRIRTSVIRSFFKACVLITEERQKWHGKAAKSRIMGSNGFSLSLSLRGFAGVRTQAACGL